MVYLAKEQISTCDFLQLKHKSLSSFLNFCITILHQIIHLKHGYVSLLTQSCYQHMITSLF